MGAANPHSKLVYKKEAKTGKDKIENCKDQQ
jgi:hypothetical protein